MAIQSSSKVIAKNTMYLYIRMMFTMIVTLYTSRVILQALGVDDYGIYQSVGGIVSFLTFINNALSGGSARFLTYELGTGNEDKLKRTFSTTFTIQVILALAIVVITEICGMWFLQHKMIIPPERINAAIYVFHFSVFTIFLTLLQVPYSACIIAHEKMTVYAYISIIEVILNLAIIYLLNVGGYDKLVLYAILLMIVQVGLCLFYFFYCYRNFVESHYKLIFDKQIFKSVFQFSSWSLFANGSIALNNQGVLILLNMFFSPSVVAARAISLQVNMAANKFVNNFRTAVNPQIVKRYAAKDYVGSKRLLLSSTKYSYYLMLAICLPLVLLAYPVLHLWLGVVPDYTTVFLQLIVIQSLFQVFDTSFYTALYAKGQLKENALISPTIGFLQFPAVFLLFKMGCSPVALSWASLLCYAFLGLYVKPKLIIRVVGYTWADVWSVFKPCLMVTTASLLVPLISSCFLKIESNIIHALLLLLLSLLSVALSVWLLGLDRGVKSSIVTMLRHHLFKKNK